MRKKYYIAHKISDRHYIRDLICPLLRKLGITPINPFYTANKQPRKARLDIGKIDSGKVHPYSIKSFEDSQDIVDRDLDLISKSNGLICFMNDASIGAAMEIFYCAYTLHKPIYIVTEKYIGHPWLICLAKLTNGFIVLSLQNLLSRIEELK